MLSDGRRPRHGLVTRTMIKHLEASEESDRWRCWLSWAL